MRYAQILVACLLLTPGVGGPSAADAPTDLARDVEHAFRSVISLFAYGECWRLWDGSTRQAKLYFSQSDFCREMERAGGRPAAGKQVEDMIVQVNSATTAIVYARLTIESHKGSWPLARSWLFRFEDGGWRHELSDILGAAAWAPPR